MHTILLFLALVCAIVATILGFHWLGTDGTNWEGWIGTTLVFYIAAHLASDLPAITVKRGD